MAVTPEQKVVAGTVFNVSAGAATKDNVKAAELVQREDVPVTE